MASQQLSPRNDAVRSPGIAEVLRRERDQIIRRWERRLRDENRAARRLTAPALRDSMPEFLEQLADALDPDRSIRPRAVPDQAKHHGQQRAERGFNLAEVLYEYVILRRVLFEVLESERPMKRDERDCMLDIIQLATRNAAIRFTSIERRTRERMIARRRSSRAARIAVSFGVVGVATALQLLTWPVVNPAPFLFYFPAVVLAARYGSGPVATLLSVVAAQYFFAEPRFSLEMAWPTDYARTAVFVACGLFITNVTHALRKALDLSRQSMEEQRALRKQVQLSEERFRSLSEQVKDYAIYMLDPEGRILTWSEGCSRIKGYSADEALGRSFEILYRAEDRAAGRPAEHLQVALRNGRFEEVHERVRKGGERFMADVLITPLYDESGRHVGFAEVLRDVTRQRDSEEKLRGALTSLELERELRDRFVATLTHDLRGPLTAIRTSAELLIRYPDKPESRERLVGRILSSVIRADRMIGNLLDVNLIRAGQKLPMRLELVDLRQIVDESLEELRAAYGDRFTIQGGGPPILGRWSPDGLRRVIENLCTNAVKYGSDASPITLSLGTVGDHAVLKVHNEGKPIPENELPLLFEPFQRSSHPDSSQKKGWGLGLTLVKGIVEAHGGAVRVRSAPGEGTTFEVSLPTRGPEA